MNVARRFEPLADRHATWSHTVQMLGFSRAALATNFSWWKTRGGKRLPAEGRLTHSPLDL